MKTFKENSYDIIRLYVNQLGIMIFSMLLYTAVGSFENQTLSTVMSIIVSVFSICFHASLIYYVVWEIGAKDKIKIDGGRMTPCNVKGMLMGVFANIPNFVLSTITLAFSIISLASGNAVSNSVFLIFNLITRFHESMYLGLITNLIPSFGGDNGLMTEFVIESALFVIMPVISILVTHLAYSLGRRDKKLFSISSSQGN